MKPGRLRRISMIFMVTILTTANIELVAEERSVDPCEDTELLPTRWVTRPSGNQCEPDTYISGSKVEGILRDAGVCALAVEEEHRPVVFSCGHPNGLVYHVKIPSSQASKATSSGWYDPRRYETKDQLERQIAYEERVLLNMRKKVVKDELDRKVHEKVKRGRIEKLNELKNTLKEYP